MKVTESMASSFIPVDRMNLRSSGLTGWTYFPQPSIRISGKYGILNVINPTTFIWFRNVKDRMGTEEILLVFKNVTG